MKLPSALAAVPSATRTWFGAAMASRRAATFTTSPMTVYSIRLSEPMLPTIASPEFTPMPRRTSTPYFCRQPSLAFSRKRMMSSAAASARCA